MTSLPTPEQWIIHRMSEPEVAEMIERHVDFIDMRGFSVHLGTNFVRHYMQRDDRASPIIVAVSTLPLVLADGQVLAEDKFDPLRGIDFHIQTEVSATVPKPGSVTDEHVESAMRFLTDEWLLDVATDYTGKCTIIAAALTLIERSLLDQPDLLRHRGTPRRRQDHYLDYADQGCDRHLASGRGVVDE